LLDEPEDYKEWWSSLSNSSPDNTWQVDVVGNFV